MENIIQGKVMHRKQISHLSHDQTYTWTEVDSREAE